MKKIVICILCILAIVAVVWIVKFRNASEVDVNAQNVNEEITDTPKSEQTGTAGSNIPLKDNMEEAEYQIKVAMQYLFEDTYGDKVFDARIYIDKIYSAEDEEEIDVLKQMNLGPNEVAFEVKFELKPSPGADITELTIPDGEYDEETEWVTGLHRVGVLRPNESSEQKYKITDYGTGW